MIRFLKNIFRKNPLDKIGLLSFLEDRRAHYGNHMADGMLSPENKAKYAGKISMCNEIIDKLKK